jgi:hypothetical protein
MDSRLPELLGEREIHSISGIALIDRRAELEEH